MRSPLFLGAAPTLAACLSGALTLASSAQAAEPVPHAVTPQPALPVAVGVGTLTGDWNGLRARLADQGVVITSTEVVDAAYDVDGADRKIGRAAGQFTLGATIDTARAWGWPQGGRLQATLTNRHGNSLTNDARLQLLQPAQTVYGRGTIWRLSQFWYEQSFADGATALKVGRVTVSEDYGATPCGNVMNLTLCGPQSSQIVGGYLFNFPVSSWGVRLRQRLAPDLHVSLGAIESNPRNLRLDKGFYLGTAGGTGMIYLGELQWTARFGPRGNLPGTYRIGTWYDTSNADDVVDDHRGADRVLTGLAAARRGHHAGVHANLVQQLIAAEADGAHGLSLVVNVALADRATNRLRGKAAVIASYTGLIPGRPRDDISFGVGATFVNDRVTDSQARQNLAGLRAGAPQEAEVAAELNYGARLTPAITLRPGVQWIHHPGGRSDRGDLIVPGLKLLVSL